MYSRKAQPVFLTALALLMGASLFSCSDDDDNGAPPAGPGSPGETPSVVTIRIPVGAMDLGDQAFGENPRTVPVGTTVTWINDDTVPHTTTSDTNVWDSGNLTTGQSFSWTFSEVGEFPYHCTVHPEMTGTIVVEASPSPSPSPSASASPSPSPSPSPDPSASPSPSPSPSFAVR